MTDEIATIIAKTFMSIAAVFTILSIPEMIRMLSTDVDVFEEDDEY